MTLQRVLEIAKEIENTDTVDVFRVAKRSDAEIRLFLTGGEDGDKRDTLEWAAVSREAKRRGLGIKVNDSKYDFY